MNIYNFLKDPWVAVKGGYRPSYLSCVSCMASGKWKDLTVMWLESFIPEWRILEALLDTTLKEFSVWLFQQTFRSLLILTFPLSMWGLAYIQYLNIKHWVKMESLERVSDED